MVCSFCHSDKPKSHNVRSCAQLDTAIGVYCAKTAVSWTLDSFTDALVAAGIDVFLTGGAATAGNAIWEGIQMIQHSVHAAKFASASRLQKSSIIKTGMEGGDVDLLLGQL